MKLRLRVALATLGVMAPLIAGLSMLDVHAQQAAAELELIEMIQARTSLPGERERCEASPNVWQHGSAASLRPPRVFEGEHPRARFGGEAPASRFAGEAPPPRFAGAPPPGPAAVRGPHRQPAAFYAYDAALRSRQVDAPLLPEHRLPLATSSSLSRSSLWHPERVEVLVRTPWPGGACAFVLARGTTEPWLGALLPPTRIWALPVLMVLLAVLLAIGPVLRRIRQLTDAVQRSAAFDYAAGVEMHGNDEIAELARAFAGAASEVRRQLEAKDHRDRALRNFVADTTHDVAIPLTVLQGHLVTLQEAASKARVPDASVLGSAMDEAHYIGALLHNLSAAAQLDATDIRLQRNDVDLRALVTRVVSRHRPLAQQRDISLEAAMPDAELHAHADVTLLEQAVSNVVYNAVRYNTAGGHVAVLLEAEGTHEFRVRVLDDGPGVTADMLTRLRERGYRGTQARTRNVDGQGLGLHITQRVLDSHGMRLQLSSPAAGGLQVDITGERSNLAKPHAGS